MCQPLTFWDFGAKSVCGWPQKSAGPFRWDTAASIIRNYQVGSRKEGRAAQVAQYLPENYGEQTTENLRSVLFYDQG